MSVPMPGPAADTHVMTGQAGHASDVAVARCAQIVSDARRKSVISDPLCRNIYRTICPEVKNETFAKIPMMNLYCS